MPSQPSGIQDMKGSRAPRASLFSRAGAFTSVAWVVACLVSWLAAGRAWANSAPLPVSFNGTGQALPQAEIRVGIATELGRETLAEAGDGEAAVGDVRLENRERVVVAVDELGQLWVRYWGPRGLVDRHLPMPPRAEQIPLVVSLSVGNLVRQEAFELLRDLERRRAEQAKAEASATAAAAETPKPPSTPKASPVAPPPPLPRSSRTPASRARAARNSWGHYLVGDFPYVPRASNVCGGGSADPCYDRDFEPISFEVQGAGVAGGIGGAQGRYVMAYSRALTPDTWGSVRVGFAFSGSNAKNAAAAHAAGVSKFMPWLFEARLQHFPFRGAFEGALRPFVHVSAGISEESAQVTLQAPRGPDGMPVAAIEGRDPITLIHTVGFLFAGGGLGTSLLVFDPLRLEAELSGFVAFPASGWFVRPSIGLTYDF
jgi:hypothetical protein